MTPDLAQGSPQLQLDRYDIRKAGMRWASDASSKRTYAFSWLFWTAMIAFAPSKVLVFLLTVLSGHGVLDASRWPALVSPLPTFLVFLASGAPLQEELGWRGYTLPRLQQRWDPLMGMLILALLWIGWHFPLFLYRRGSLRGHLLLAGTLGSFLYAYASMAFNTVYNALFLAYVALLSASLFAFVLAFSSVDLPDLPGHFSSHLPRRSIAGFLFASPLAVPLIAALLGRDDSVAMKAPLVIAP